MAAEKTVQSDLAIKKAATNKEIAGKPSRILLPRQGIDLPVVDGQYNFTSAAWSVSKTTANYASNTAEINNRQDKTLIYGHWTPAVFGPTKDLKPGDIAYVYTANNHILVYRYKYKDRKSTRLNSSHSQISYAVFCLKK